MEVNIVDCSINVQQLYEKVLKYGPGAVALFVGNRNDIFAKSVLSTVTGQSRNQVINAFLTEVCREVKEKHEIKNIVLNCWLDASDHEPCLAVACLASSYHQASEAVNGVVDLINGSKKKLNCDDPVVDVVSADLIQVKASREEINQRINSFIQRRREQVNKDNIRDFCCSKVISDENSCARVNAVKIHRKDSKSHLRVRKVFNLWGPQTSQKTVQETFSQLVDDVPIEAEGFARKGTFSNNGTKGKTILMNNHKDFALNERIRNVEEHIGFEVNASSDIHSRLKKIEDKILYLEGLSPEYFEFWDRKSNKSVSVSLHKTNAKKSYSPADLSKKIKELEANVQLGGE